MELWDQNPAGKKWFKHGQNSYGLAAEAARQCVSFACDDDDEIVCDDERSCYNCRYRRWTTDSLECMKL